VSRRFPKPIKAETICEMPDSLDDVTAAIANPGM
jgi:hypothetical protein